MKLHNISKGIINFQGRLIEPNARIYVSEETLQKYKALVYRYYEEKKAIVEDINGKPLTIEELKKILNGEVIENKKENETMPNYLSIVNEVNEENEAKVKQPEANEANENEPEVAQTSNEEQPKGENKPEVAQVSQEEPKEEPKEVAEDKEVAKEVKVEQKKETKKTKRNIKK